MNWFYRDHDLTRLGVITTWFVINLLLALLLSCMPVYACDSAFLQEPTTRLPDDMHTDTVAGFLWSTWDFPIDGRTLTTARIILRVTPDAVTIAEAHPLFYIVTDKEHASITYIDRERRGRCYEIERY